MSDTGEESLSPAGKRALEITAVEQLEDFLLFVVQTVEFDPASLGFALAFELLEQQDTATVELRHSTEIDDAVLPPHSPDFRDEFFDGIGVGKGPRTAAAKNDRSLLCLFFPDEAWLHGGIITWGGLLWPVGYNPG
jgi:hypothetical protein